MHLLNPLRRWFYRVKLNLILSEVQDTLDDMADELSAKNFGNYGALAEFHTDLLVEADNLRRKLAALS